MTQLRCAIYARFSSDRQSPSSITDQIRKCREYAARQGWIVLDRHIHADEAIHGASMERSGLKALVAAAVNPARQFDCILVDDTSRLSRKLADALNLYERLSFAGIRIVAVSQGVDSDDAQAEILLGVHGLIDGVYWRELGQKTHRGLEGRALKGMATGGRCFGYRTERDAEGNAKLVILEAQAEIIRRIFKLYASGFSLKRIAHLLNAEGILSPQPQKGRISRSWCVSAIRWMLRNRRYNGEIVWNTRQKVRVPGTGKRIWRPRPESEWVIVDAPQLRIVDRETFAAVRRRFETVKNLWSRAGARNSGLLSGQQRSVYLFSGLLRCAECGGSIALVSGRCKTGRDKYGCSMHWQRGDTVCKNGLLIRREELERRMLRGLQENVLREEVITYAVERLGAELEKHFVQLDSHLETLRERKRQIDTEIRRLVDSIASGEASPSVMAAIAAREHELCEITDKLLERRPASLRTSLDQLRTLAVSRLTALQGLLSHPDSINEARALLAEQVGKIDLAPVSNDGRWTYYASGEVDFFSNSRVGGAEGQS